MRVILIIILHLLELMEVTMSLHAPFTLLDFDIGNSSASDRSHDPIPFGFPLIGSRIRGGGGTREEGGSGGEASGGAGSGMLRQ
jgi:hypothetical protein